MFFIALFSEGLCAQELFVPRNIKQAYANGTRDVKGVPGKNYWQNHAKYTIRMEVSPPNRRVVGFETIAYTNNSPDTLKELNFKLIVNHHKANAPRANAVTQDYLTSGIHIDRLTENGSPREWKMEEKDGTDKFLKLTHPLVPGETINFEVEWHYDISKESGREGALSEHTYFVGYFYPRIAVYDDYEGWDVMPHIMAQEFYNDFNDYELEIRVPKNYVVWATGELQNVEEVLQQPYLDRYEQAKTSDSIVSIITQKDLEGKQITTQNETNVWKWKAQHVTDVAFALSNEYKWDAGSLGLEEGRRALVQAAYDEPSKDFEQMAGYIKHALQWFSERYPGVPYPYPSMTIVRGFADMEFPMMANDSSMPDHPEFTKFVAEHEIAHTYMPFYMGTNETRFGFMDEGWATTFEYLVGREDLGEAQAAENFKNFRVKSWAKNASFLHDLPIITPTNVLSRPSMSDNEYGKPALAYLSLMDLLGEHDFKRALHGYMERWNGKHPMPWDFFYSFNDILNKDLNWFWTAWFFEPNHIDYSIAEIKESAVVIHNRGGFPTPFDLILTYVDGSEEHLHQTPAVWQNNLKEAVIPIKKHKKELKEIRIDTGIYMDFDETDNIWKSGE